MAVTTKLIFYMSALFGVGYGAMKYVQMNEEKLIKELSSTSDVKTDAEKKRKLMMDVLRAAADNK